MGSSMKAYQTGKRRMASGLARSYMSVVGGWQAFKQDHDALVQCNTWHLDTAHEYNFFPGTNSIEVLAVFKRGKKLPKKPVKKESGMRSKSAKSLQFTKASLVIFSM